MKKIKTRIFFIILFLLIVPNHKIQNKYNCLYHTLTILSTIIPVKLINFIKKEAIQFFGKFKNLSFFGSKGLIFNKNKISNILNQIRKGVK